MKILQIPKDKKYEIKSPIYASLLDVAVEFQSQFALDFNFYTDGVVDNKATYTRWVCYLVDKNMYKSWLLVCQILGVEFHPYMEVEV